MKTAVAAPPEPGPAPRPLLVLTLEETIREMEASFDLRWKADMRAIKRWQEAHPGNDLVWPDHADMVVWLLEQLDAARRPQLQEEPDGNRDNRT